MMSRFKVKIVFFKDNFSRYLSQLDLVRTLERAIRRSRLPFYLTSGFRPHVKMSFKNALKLGERGKIEVIFYFREKVAASLIKERLKPHLPLGFTILEIEEVNG